MKCDDAMSVMLDIIYGEEVAPTKACQFFDHLKGCSRCEGEFRELAETREMLRPMVEGDRNLSAPEHVRLNLPSSRGINWWGIVQKAAAVVLMVFGAAAAGQALGWIPGRQAELPEAELTRMINDVVVERQTEGWMVIGKALVGLKEELNARDRHQEEIFYQDLNEMEERFLRVMEESQPRNRNITSQ